MSNKGKKSLAVREAYIIRRGLRGVWVAARRQAQWPSSKRARTSPVYVCVYSLMVLYLYMYISILYVCVYIYICTLYIAGREREIDSAPYRSFALSIPNSWLPRGKYCIPKHFISERIYMYDLLHKATPHATFKRAADAWVYCRRRELSTWICVHFLHIDTCFHVDAAIFRILFFTVL